MRAGGLPSAARGAGYVCDHVMECAILLEARRMPQVVQNCTRLRQHRVPSHRPSLSHRKHP